MVTETPPQDRPNNSSNHLSNHHRPSPPTYGGPSKNGINAPPSGGERDRGVGPPHMQHDLEVAQACLNLRQESGGKGGDRDRDRDPHRPQGGPPPGHELHHGNYGHGHGHGHGPPGPPGPPGPGPDGGGGRPPSMGRGEGPPSMGGPNMNDDPRNSVQTPQQMDPRSAMMGSMPPPNMGPMHPGEEVGGGGESGGSVSGSGGGGGRLGGMPMQQQMSGPFMPPHMMEIGPNGLPPGAMKDMHPYYQNMGENGHFYPQFHSPDADPYHAMMNGMGMRDMSQYYGMMNQGEPGMMPPNGHFYPPMMPPDAGHFSPMMQGYPHGGYMQQKRPHPGDDMSYHQPDMKRGRNGNLPSPNMKQEDVPIGAVGTKKLPEKQKKGKRASDMPRRPLSAYNFFFSEERERILAAIPEPNEKKNTSNENGDGDKSEEKKSEIASPEKGNTASTKVEEKDEVEERKDGEKPEIEESKPVEQDTKDDEKKDGNDVKVNENGNGAGGDDGNTDEKKEEEKEKTDENAIPEGSRMTKEQIAEKMAARSKRLLALREQQSNKRRPHRKTHGKIGFKELVKKIGERWRALPAEEKEYYSGLAKTDLRRYKEQMTEYNNKHNRIGS